MFPQIFGKYVLERELASGGMARVYLAMLRGAVGFEKRLVVKQIRPELASDPAFVRRFVEEAKTTVELSHPNIVPVYELGVEQGVYYIAMELCAGITLAEILKRSGPLSPDEGAYLGVEVCRALDYAHRRAGIIHRDVTPRNVLIDEEGAVRLIDFGIAAPASASGPREVFGSPGHMPPEQMAGQALTPATDVFAVSVLLFEAWTGRAAFRRATAKASAEAVAAGPPPLTGEAPELLALAPLLASGLALNAKERPAGAEAFARPLRDFLRPVDVGDVARRLGARVQAAQRRPSTPPTANSRAPRSDSISDARDSRPSSEPMATRTFAARNEVSQWTRRLESERPPGTPTAQAEAGPSTRPVSSRPAESGPGDSSSLSAPHTPSIAQPDPPREAADSPREALSPTEREVRPTTSSGPWLGVTLGGLLLAGAIVLVASVTRKSPSVTATDGARRAAPSPVLAPPQLAPVAVALEPLPAPSTSAAALSGVGSAAAVTTKPRAATSAEASNSAGRVRITADPPASVTIQGASGTRTLGTPVHELRLPNGDYVVTFNSSTYGSPVTTRISLKTGQMLRVHADFRELEPRVSVQ